MDAAATAPSALDVRDAGCAAFAESLLSLNLNSAAFIVSRGVRGAAALDAVRRDIDGPGVGCRVTLRALLECYRHEQYGRLARAVAAWNRRGCEDCARHAADPTAPRCADCDDLDAMTGAAS